MRGDMMRKSMALISASPCPFLGNVAIIKKGKAIGWEKVGIFGNALAQSPSPYTYLVTIVIW